MPSNNHPIVCPFYATYGIQLRAQTNMNMAIRVIENQYNGVLLEVSLKQADIEQLEENGEDWVSIYRYSGYLGEHQYQPAFLALEKALAYFNTYGYPPAQSPILELFHLLISIVNHGGLTSFQTTGLLNPVFSNATEATLFNSWGGFDIHEANPIPADYLTYRPEK